MALSIRLTAGAEHDLEDIYRYILTSNSRASADRVLEKPLSMMV